MYLALQHGIFVANYPLVDEDFESADLPRPLQPLRQRCFGIVTTPQRLSQVRSERRANSRYASLELTHWQQLQGAPLIVVGAGQAVHDVTRRRRAERFLIKVFE